MDEGSEKIITPFIAHFILLTYYFLYLMQLVECFKRREIIDVDTHQLIAHHAEHRVVELEEAQLHALARLRDVVHLRFAFSS